MGSKVLVIGGTGMLGLAVANHLADCGYEVVTAARHEADILLDMTKEEHCFASLADVNPEIIVNSAALVNLENCENDPRWAWQVNAKAVFTLANYSIESGCKLVQISTDHYYTGDGAKLHKERDPVCLLNEYAKTKYAAECFALCAPKSLVLRTNVAGFRGKKGAATFSQWLLESIEKQHGITLFNDFHTSTIDTAAFSKILADLLAIDHAGLLNLASRDVCNKEQFACAVARHMGCDLVNAKSGSVKALKTRRAESLGLDVARITSLLGYEMPSLDQVVSSLITEYRNEV